MKVLWFANTPCGAVTYLTGKDVKNAGWLYALCEHLKQQDEIELHIAFFWGCEMDKFLYNGVMYHPILRDGDASVIGRYFHRIRNQFSNADDEKELTRCIKVVEDVVPDIIHIHGSEEVFGQIAQDNISIPIVMSVQGMLSACRAKYFAGFARHDMLRCERWEKKMLMDGINGKYRSITRRAKREINIYRSINYIIGRTKWDRRSVLSINPGAKYYVVNEILRSSFMSSEWTKWNPQTPFALVTTISVGVYKGLEVIYKTAQLLIRAKFPFVWNIIGLSNTSDMVKTAEKILHLRSSEMHINLLGAKQADEMVRIMQQSDVYVQVSHIENSSNSLCEAMALGMPIIASFAGGTSSILQDGVEGVLLQDGNCYELAGAIMEAKLNYSSFVQMGRKARARALERHDPKQVVQELLNVYSDIYSQE